MSQILVTGEAKIRDIQGPVVANSGVVTALDGDASQYVRGDGTLADFPTSTGGGSSVSYYLNSSVSQGTIGGVAYRELSKEPVIGAGTDIAISANGYVANYLTDANDPDVLSIPGGNFNCEFYFSVNNNSGNPTFYAELYKYDGTTFTLLGSSVGVPESINQGTTIAPYYFAIPVATAALALTDRLAIRIYVNVSGRTVTLHTENGHLCQVVTTLSKGMVSLNNLTDQSQFITTGTAGTNFAIVSSGDTHTFNLPVASAANTGKLSSTDWSTFNGKVPYTGATSNVDLGLNNLTANNVFGETSLNIKVLPSGSVFSTGYSTLSSLAGKFTMAQEATSGNLKAFTFDFSAWATNTSRTYTLPDASGTLALTSNLSSYVPYTGATANVDLGANNLTANYLTSGNIVFWKGTGSGLGNIGLGRIVPLGQNTTGQVNIGIGENALFFNTTGSNNIALGGSANGNNTTGSSNIGIGSSANYANTTASNNIAIGLGALANNTVDNNVAIGHVASYLNTTGNFNVAVGYATLYTNTTGSSNTAIGSSALYSTTTGVQNTAIGKTSMFYNTTGGSNTAIGTASLQSNTTGSSNTGIGTAALGSNTTGVGNIAIGNASGFAIITGSNNTIIGNYAGTAAMSNNIILADGAGNIRYQWDGTNNVFGNPISGTYATFSSIVTTGVLQVTASTAAASASTGYVDYGGTGIRLFSVGTSGSTKGTFTFFARGADNSSITPLSISNTGDVTLTGALSGTSATFSGNLTVNAEEIVINKVGGAFLSLLSADTDTQYIQFKDTGGASGSIRYSHSSNSMIIKGNGSDMLTFASTGAATFSSSLTAGAITADNADVYAQNGTGSNLSIGFKQSSAVKFRLRYDIAGDTVSMVGSTGNFIQTWNQSGNVGILTTSPNSTLQVGDFSGNNAISIGASTTGVSSLYFGDGSGAALYRGFIEYQHTGDYMRFGTSAAEAMRITSGGDVLVGMTSATGAGLTSVRAGLFSGQRTASGDTVFQAWNQGTTGDNKFVEFYTEGGGGSFRGSIDYNRAAGLVRYNVTSDYRLKTDLQEFNGNDILNKVKVYDYQLKETGARVYGVMAHELQEVIPYAVGGSKDGEKMQSVDYSIIVPILIKAVQELEARIKQLENK